MKQIAIVLGVSGFTLLTGCSSGPSDTSWLRLMGSPAEESAHAVAVAKDGAVFAVGSTQGSVDDAKSRGGLDAFVAKYNTDGKLEWKKTLGTTENEEARAVTTDADGNVYVTGYTGGALDGGNGPKDDQVFVAKLDSSGKTVWLSLFGETTPVNVNSTKESGEGIVLSGTSLFVTGYTVNSFGKSVGEAPERDAFVLKVDADGKQIEAKVYGSNRNDSGAAIAVAPDGAVYLAGSSDGSMGVDQTSSTTGSKPAQHSTNPNEGFTDAFVMRLGVGEEDSWTRHAGTTSSETGTALAVDSTTGDVYVGGTAANGLEGIQPLGMGDGFVAKFDKAGNFVWQHLVGGSSIDTLEGLAVGTSGRVFATGATWSDLRSGESTGRTDVYLTELNPANGAQVNVLQRTGSENQAWGKGIISDGLGRLIIVGRAEGTMEDQKGAGGFDALLWKVKESELAPVKK